MSCLVSSGCFMSMPLLLIRTSSIASIASNPIATIAWANSCHIMYVTCAVCAVMSKACMICTNSWVLARLTFFAITHIRLLKDTRLVFIVRGPYPATTTRLLLLFGVTGVADIVVVCIGCARLLIVAPTMFLISSKRRNLREATHIGTILAGIRICVCVDIFLSYGRTD